jgi:hypothetical protein
MLIRTMRKYAAKRRWTVAIQIKEVGSGLPTYLAVISTKEL